MARTRPYAQPWVESPHASDHLRSAAALARFALTSDDLTEEHRYRLLNNAVWYVTEAAGKYKTRFRSASVLSLETKAPLRKWWSELRHDHVTRRAALLQQLKTADADVEAILRSAVSCVVTKSEHERLSRFDETLDGWDRYRAAGVDVYDMATGDLFIEAGKYV
jgi:hypothetical protein